MIDNDFRYSIFDIFLKIFLVMSAILYWPGIMAYKPQEIFIQYSAVCFFGLSLFVPRRRTTSNVFLAIILFYALFHTLLLHFEDRSRLQMMNMFLGVVIIKVIAERIKLDVSSIGRLYIGFAVLNIGMMIFQYFDLDPIFTNVNFDKMQHVEMVGFLGSRFALGCIGALITPFIFTVSPWACLIVVPLLIVGKSSTAVAAALFCFMFLMWFKNRFVFWSLVLFFIGGAIYYVVFIDAPSGQFAKRFKVWWLGLHMLRGNPLLGHGLGSWLTSGIRSVQENGEPEHWSWAHNEYLQYMFETGVIGIITLYAYFKNFIKKIDLNILTQRTMVASFLCMAAISVFHFPFHIGRLASICLLTFALMEAQTSNVEPNYCAV